MASISVTARWLFPVAGPPLERGVLAIEDGRIARVVPGGTEKPDFDLGNAAITPGFVNAHTHLDLTGARGRTPPKLPFTDWLESVIAFRRSQSSAQVVEDIGAGIAESRRFGTTLLGDISVDGVSANVIADDPIRATVFRELLGLSLERARHSMADAAPWLISGVGRDWLRIGLSPHAPYSFHYRNLESLSHCTIAIGTHQTYPLAVHLAESADERELLESHAGPFVPFLQKLGVWDPDGLARSPEQIVALTQAARTMLFIHCNYLKPETPIPNRASIVYCPRTHAAFGFPPHPFREFLARGVRVALGTDSLASNPDLSLLAEARFLAARFPDLDRSLLLQMATLSGAEALDWAGITGTLAPGKSADFAVVQLPDRDAADPHELLFNSELPVQSTWFRGKPVFAID